MSEPQGERTISVSRGVYLIPGFCGGAAPHTPVQPQPRPQFPPSQYPPPQTWDPPRPAPPTRRRSRAGWWIAAAIGLVLLLGFGGCLALVAVGSGGGDGDDLADLRDACAGGDMAACDDLFEESDVDSEDGFFGATCGLRTDASFAGECEASFGSVVE